MVEVLNRENINFEEQDIQLIAKKADGSMRDSLSLLDQVIAYSGDTLEVELVRSSLGIIHDSLYVNLFIGIATKDMNIIITELDNLSNAGHSIDDFISGFNEIMRNALIVSSGIENKNLPIEIVKMVYGQDSVFQKMDILRMLELSMNFETRLRYVQQPQIALESLFIKFASMDLCFVVRDIISGNFEIDSNQDSKPVILSEKSRTAELLKPESKLKVEKNTPELNLDSDSDSFPPNDSPRETEKEHAESHSNNDLSLENIVDGWREVIIETEKINAKISNLLEEVKLQDFSGTILTIMLTNDQKFHAKSLRKDSSKIEIALKEIYGSEIRLNFIMEEISSSSGDEDKKKVNEADKEHPLFMKTLEKFEGEVLR